MCAFGELASPGSADAPSEHDSTKTHAMALEPGADGRCDALRLDVVKFADKESGLAEFDPHEAAFRVTVGGCQSGDYIAEQIKPEGIFDRLEFTVDLGDLDHLETRELCVVKIEPDYCVEQQAWWVSHRVPVTRIGCDIDVPDPTAVPDPPPSDDDVDGIDCTRSTPSKCQRAESLYEVQPSADDLQVWMCRAPRGDEAPRETLRTEHVARMRHIPGGWLETRESIGETALDPLWMADLEMTSRFWWLVNPLDPGAPFAAAAACQAAHTDDASASGECPIANMSWWSALEFANRLSELAGLPTCYRLDEAGCDLDAGSGRISCAAAVPVNTRSGDPRDCRGYRLPTEAEWIHAALDGGTEAELPPAEEAANYCDGEMTCRPEPACSDAGHYGLCHMRGNMWEWVWDQAGPGVVGTEPCAAPEGHRTKGGGWGSSIWSIDVDGGGCYPERAGGKLYANDVGFRIVRTHEGAERFASGTAAQAVDVRRPEKMTPKSGQDDLRTR